MTRNTLPNRPGRDSSTPSVSIKINIMIHRHHTYELITPRARDSTEQKANESTKKNENQNTTYSIAKKRDEVTRSTSTFHHKPNCTKGHCAHDTNHRLCPINQEDQNPLAPHLQILKLETLYTEVFDLLQNPNCRHIWTFWTKAM